MDDVPFGTSTPFLNGENLTFDPALFDLAQIEVLRGPQGTLYGASTLGGLVKYVSAVPDETKFSGRVQTGVASTQDGGISYNGSGTVNLPLINGLAAIRATGFYSHDGGFIDNVTLGQKDINRSGVYGGRLDLLLTPTEALSIRLNYFQQDIERDGQSTVDFALHGTLGTPLAGPLDQEREVPEPFGEQLRLTSLNLAYDFGPVKLTSISGYQSMKSLNWIDTTGPYAPLCAYGGFTCAKTEVPSLISTSKFTQEVRAVSSTQGPLQWTFGGFYNRESSLYYVAIKGLGILDQPVGDLLDQTEPELFEERAVFGDLTYHLTEKFDVTGGVRWSGDKQVLSQHDTGVIGANAPETDYNGSAVTYLANARYHFSTDATGYLRYATGYRAGGPDLLTTFGPPPPGTPTSFKPDTLKSYEAGYKAEFSDHRFEADVDVYHIDWSDIHELASINGFGIVVNSGKAAINGAELSLTVHATREFALSGAFAFTHAYLVNANDYLGASAGARLPNVPRFTAMLNADYNFPGAWRPTIGLSARRVTDRYSSFDRSPFFPQYFLPAYTTVDLRAGLAIGATDLQLYVRNLNNEYIQQSAYGVYSPPGVTQVAISQPRTVGLSAIFHF